MIFVVNILLSLSGWAHNTESTWHSAMMNVNKSAVIWRFEWGLSAKWIPWKHNYYSSLVCDWILDDKSIYLYYLLYYLLKADFICPLWYFLHPLELKAYLCALCLFENWQTLSPITNTQIPKTGDRGCHYNAVSHHQTPRWLPNSQYHILRACPYRTRSSWLS